MSPTFEFLVATIIFGTNGFFIKYIQAPNELSIMFRGLFGSLFLLCVMFLNKDLPDLKRIKSNFKYLALSGIVMGLYWILLYKGYDYSLSVTALINNMAPIFAMLVSTVIFKEKISNKQAVCVCFVLLGIVLISGVLDGQLAVDYHSLLYGFAASFGFVAVLMINKKINDVKPLDKSFIQLFFAFLTILPVVIFGHKIPSSIDSVSLIFMISMGMINTGLAYMLYFHSLPNVSGYKIAILSYLESIIAILIDTFIFNQPLGIHGMIGAAIIIVSACMSELMDSNKSKQEN